ncbi:NACHT, LRR and PYD domains-containing protein 3-like isoform 5-T5 [Pholidichthys leucotaenia]
MDQDPEDRARPSKPVWGDHEVQTKGQRSEQHSGPGPGPGPSCVSIRSDLSKDFLIDFKHAHDDPAQRIHQQRTDSPGPGPGSSCVSMRSDKSMEGSINFSDDQRDDHQNSEPPPSDLDSILMLLEQNMISFVKNELKKIQKLLSQRGDEEVLEGEDEDQRRNRESFLMITVDFLRRMKQEKLADLLKSKIHAGKCRQKLKSNLQERFQRVFEGIAKAGNPSLLKQIYTELYITEGGTAEVNDEHEVRQIETASRKPHRPETTIRPEDIFKGSPGRDEPIRRVLTKGVAGIGKTVLTQKFTLDWAEDKAHQDIHFTFPFTFRELNVLKEKKFSLVELVHHFFTETKEAGICSFDQFQVLFIFDGLDECRLPLDFYNFETVTDPRKSTSVDVLLTNLISRNLLPSAHLWITTRPAAANQIPPEYVDMVTEVRGFADPQKEQYFRKRFRDEQQASRIISHMKTSRSLHIMCHIPVFCWITATVLEDEMKTRDGGELPKTLTEMYIHFLVVQTKVKKVKYEGGAETDPHWSPDSRKMIESLGKLAFEQLQKGNLIFYESDLAECGIDVKKAAKYSGVFTQIFREEKSLYQDQNQVFCFVHLSVQEFLASLHVHLTFITSGVNLLEEEQKTSLWSKLFKEKINLSHLHHRAVDKAIQSPNGHLDLFLRFLLGLSLQTNQRLLQGLLTQAGSSSQTNEETVQYIKEKLSENVSVERSINLFHCLNELNDHSLVEQIQQSLRSGRLNTKKLSPSQWSALVFILLSSETDLDVFDLKKYSASEEALLRLLPVVKASKKSLLNGCELTERSCEVLSSVLSSPSSSLRHLDLSNNNLKDSGVKILSAGLQNVHCKLESLSLSVGQVSEEGCEALSSVLSSPSSSLRHLDLRNNNLKDSVVKILSAGLQNHCKLESLSLSVGQVSEEGCEALSSVLSSPSSSLRHLDLRNNNLKDSVVKILSAGLQNHCKLESLSLSVGQVSEEGCEVLSSVLSSPSSSLKHLDLSNNDLKDSGVKILSGGLQNLHCKLESLSLSGCQVLEEGCEVLSSVLSSPSSSLRHLDLRNNNLKDSGVKILSAGLQNLHCKLESLSLSGCHVSKGGCEALSSVLSSPSSSLKHLDLSNNDLKDSGVKILSAVLQNLHCKLESLRLSGCLVSEEGCSSLASALRSNPSHLRDLDLSYNHPGESGVKILSDLQEDPGFRLDTLRVDHGGEQRLKPGVRKYFCQLELDTNSVNRNLQLSDNNRKVTRVKKKQNYPDHPDRFDYWYQLLCRNGLTGRCYWEVERRGRVYISVSYRGIRRKGDSGDCWFGCNNQSWSLICDDDGSSVRHNNISTSISSRSVSTRVGVYVDCPAGILSFYSVSSDSLILLHTVKTTFTEPLYPGFWFWSSGSSVSV